MQYTLNQSVVVNSVGHKFPGTVVGFCGDYAEIQYTVAPDNPGYFAWCARVRAFNGTLPCPPGRAQRGYLLVLQGWPC